MYSIHDISDYIINACKVEGNTNLSVLKHQKLLYYVQSWYLAFFSKPAFKGDFEAWVHGPVNRSIYNSYKNSHLIYSELSLKDIKNKNFYNMLDQDIINHINSVLEVYAPMSGSELEELTHRELPWLEARGDLGPYRKCEKAINSGTMEEYYKSRIK